MMDRGYICLGKIITGSHTCKDSGVSLLLFVPRGQSSAGLLQVRRTGCSGVATDPYVPPSVSAAGQCFALIPEAKSSPRPRGVAFSSSLHHLPVFLLQLGTRSDGLTSFMVHLCLGLRFPFPLSLDWGFFSERGTDFEVLDTGLDCLIIPGSVLRTFLLDFLQAKSPRGKGHGFGSQVSLDNSDGAIWG